MRLTLEQVRALAQPIAWRVGVPQGLLVAMAVCESGDRRHPEKGCDTLARRQEGHLPPVDGEPDESRGLMQILCSTARDLGVKDLAELWDPRTNLAIGARYLRQIKAYLYPRDIPDSPGCLLNLPSDRREKWLLSVAGYNAGMGRVKRAIERVGIDSHMSEVLELLDGDPERKSANERTTMLHVSYCANLWRDDDARADHEA